MSVSGYDIIGDVHGCANTLACLLRMLGYTKQDGVFYHPSRQAIFVGDIVDRGPRIREALHIVRNMVLAGTAHCVMGNHEYNALGYTTATPETEGSDTIKYVRAHNARHNRLIAETLMQFASYPEEWRVFLEWFRELPVYIEFDSFRVVHACWDRQLIQTFGQSNHVAKLDKSFIQRSQHRSAFEGRFLDRLTRGTDLALPKGRTITSKDGYERHMFRTKFWALEPETFGDVVFQPDPLPDDIAQIALTEENKKALIFYGENEKPVFFGHYWLQGKPRPLRPNVCCLDYSAVKYGRLVAYRFDGEAQLASNKFVWVDVAPEHEAKQH
ncbi:MAG: metallophosphoesterase [Agarilytica sp.]